MMKTPLLSLVVFGALLGLANDVRAETSELMAKDLVKICQGKPVGEWDKRTPDYFKAYCDGYVEASTVLFHSGKIRDFMSKTACFDLGGEIPNWETPIHNAVRTYVATKPKVDDIESAPRMIAKAVAKEFPCAKGAIPQGEDDFRTYGTAE